MSRPVALRTFILITESQLYNKVTILPKSPENIQEEDYKIARLQKAECTELA